MEKTMRRIAGYHEPTNYFYELEEVDIHECSDTSTAIEISQCDIDYIDFNNIFLKKIKHLSIVDTPIQSINMSDIANAFPNLRTIRISGTLISGFDILPLEKNTKLSRIEVTRNKLDKIDLFPIRSMIVNYLSLSNNNISHLDLAPLSHHNYLMSINLSYNIIKNIDIIPLSTCPILKELTIRHNSDFIDMTPFFFSTNKILVDNTAFHFLLKYLKRPAFYKSSYNKKIFTIRDLLDRHGSWTKVIDDIDNLLQNLRNNGYNEIRIRQGLLFGLDMYEFLKCSFTIDNILDRLKSSPSIEILANLRTDFIHELSLYLDNNTDTSHIDIEDMMRKESNVLIPKILDIRRKEIENLSFEISGKSVDFTRLLDTYYGKMLQKSIRIRRTGGIDRLEKIRNIFKKMDFDITW